MNAHFRQLSPKTPSSLGQRIRQWFVDWLVRDLHLRGVQFGENSITLSPSGVGDVVRWSATQAAAALGDLGMSTATGRPSAFIGGSARNLLGEHEVIVPSGANAWTANQSVGGFVFTSLGAGTSAGHSVRYEQAILTSGVNAFAANQSMGGFKLTNNATPTASADAATKGYVDNLVSGIQWIAPVDAKDYYGNIETVGLVGNLAALAIEALTPAAGDAYVVTTANGVGALSTATVGDIWEYSGATWVKLVTGSGGFVPVNTRATLSTATALIAPYTDVTDDAKLATFSGASNTATLSSFGSPGAVFVVEDGVDKGDVVEFSGTVWVTIVANVAGFVADNTRLVVVDAGTPFAPLTSPTDRGKIIQFDGTTNDATGLTAPDGFYTPADGDAVLVNGESSVNENKAYVFDGTVPTGTWNQFAGAGGDHGVLTGLADDDHTQYALLAGRGSSQNLRGGTTAGGSLNLQSTSNATKGNIVIGNNSTVSVDEANSRVGFGTSTPGTFMDAAGLLTGQVFQFGAATAGDLIPATDNTGRLGIAGNRWSLVRATTITSGDHNFVHQERGVAWTMTEFEDGLYMVNRKSGKWFKMSMTPCAARCADSELAPIQDELSAIAAK